MDIKKKGDEESYSDVPDDAEDVPLQEDEILETDGQLALAKDPAADPDNPPVTREQRRSRRKREIRARTISVKRMTKRELEIGRLLYPDPDYHNPQTPPEPLHVPP